MTIFLPLPKPKMKFRFVLVIVVATTFLFGCDREEEVKPVKVGLPSGPFAIVDISGGSEVGEYPVEFSKSLPADVDNQEYRTDRIIFKWIEKEKFRRGGSRKAAPIHEVELTHGFYMAIFEVTQAQWENVMGPTAFHFEGNPVRPAESVSWEDIRGASDSCDWPRERGIDESSFMGRLSAKTGEGLLFDLPTESQWEFACRAGTETEWSFGGSAADPEDYVWSDDNADDETQEVGTLRPNSWGLYDMHGNVAEWCLDRHGPYPKDAQIDPVGPTVGWYRIWRGGAWDVASDLTQSAGRSGGLPSGRYPHVGLRPVALPVN